MGSINFGPFGENWFKKQPIRFPPINLLPLAETLNPYKPHPNFASISSWNPFKKSNKKSAEEEDVEMRNKLLQRQDVYDWECENRPDYRYAPEVEKILNEDPVLEKKEKATPEELEENEKWWSQFENSPVIQFLSRVEEISDKLHEFELQENSHPCRSGDKKLWSAVPNVMGLDGRPMPRKSIQTDEEADDKFWDFAKQFFFGLWGFRQRPYPPGRPIDVAQAIGYSRLEKRYYDFIMKTSGWFYKDRLGRTRGPMELIQLRTAWCAGIIDKHTFIWGEDMDEWAPICMIYGMERAVATWDARMGAAATAFFHKLQKGIPPWVPLKGHENKTYKQLQEEAYESKRRDLAVLEANNGTWPGARIPSHAMFLWASGSELTSILEADHMPNKYIPKDLRLNLAKAIPGLRPWEVLSVEQAMDQITYGGEWYRQPLGSYTTGPPYIRDENKLLKKFYKVTIGGAIQVYGILMHHYPVVMGKVMEALYKERGARRDKWLKMKDADKDDQLN